MSLPLRHLDLFSGIGGFAYAAACVGGYQTTQFVEIDPFCQRVLTHHWPSTPIHSDIRTFTAAPNTYDIITAGFPCQDLSSAGKQLGFNGNRSVLFYEIIRVLGDIQPKFLVLENVANLLSHAHGETFQEVLFQIAKAGYNAEWAVIPASDLGACHKRSRFWLVAYPHSGHGQPKPISRSSVRSKTGQQGTDDHIGGADEVGTDAADAPFMFSDGSTSQYSWQSTWEQVSKSGNGNRQNAMSKLNPNWRTYLSKPVLRRGDDGLSGRVDRLKALGNAVVPQVAMVPLRRVLMLHTSTLSGLAADLSCAAQKPASSTAAKPITKP